MTFKDYLIKFVGIIEVEFINDWGWFVDTEYLDINDSNKYSNKYNNFIHQSRYISLSIPTTIKEYPSIRSLKSINNLHEMNNYHNDNKHITKNMKAFICINTIGILSVALIIYTCY